MAWTTNNFSGSARSRRLLFSFRRAVSAVSLWELLALGGAHQPFRSRSERAHLVDSSLIICAKQGRTADRNPYTETSSDEKARTVS